MPKSMQQLLLNNATIKVLTTLPQQSTRKQALRENVKRENERENEYASMARL